MTNPIFNNNNIQHSLIPPAPQQDNPGAPGPGLLARMMTTATYCLQSAPAYSATGLVLGAGIATGSVPTILLSTVALYALPKISGTPDSAVRNTKNVIVGAISIYVGTGLTLIANNFF